MNRCSFIILVTASLGLMSCGSLAGGGQPSRIEEPYRVAFRQSPPPPVYNRVIYSNLPRPITTDSGSPTSTGSDVGLGEKVEQNKAKLYQPVMRFKFSPGTFGEAVEAISQTIGYKLEYPAEYAKRRVALDLTGTIDQALAELERQARVTISLEHDAKAIRVSDGIVRPKLPVVR